MEVTCYWIIISLKNQSHTVSKRNRLFGPKSGFLKERSYNWWIQVLLKDVIVQWCNDLYLRFLLQTRGQNKIWLKRLTSLTWQPKDWLTALKRWSPLEPEWSHWVQMPMDICLHGHTTTSQRWGRDLAGLKERERDRYIIIIFIFFFCHLNVLIIEDVRHVCSVQSFLLCEGEADGGRAVESPLCTQGRDWRE